MASPKSIPSTTLGASKTLENPDGIYIVAAQCGAADKDIAVWQTVNGSYVADAGISFKTAGSISFSSPYFCTKVQTAADTIIVYYTKEHNSTIS